MLRTDFINDNEVDLYATLKPAKEVGGDMYDFLRVGRTIYFAVGDVSGKGVPAALYMAISLTRKKVSLLRKVPVC